MTLAGTGLALADSFRQRRQGRIGPFTIGAGEGADLGLRRQMPLLGAQVPATDGHEQAYAGEQQYTADN